MQNRVSPDDLMRYLDGEMPAGERHALEAEVERSTELRREVAIWQAMQRDFQGLSFAPPSRDGSVWGTVNRRLTRPLGWILLIGGAALWLAYIAWMFVLSPVAPWGKIAIGAIVIGFLFLLASVIVERYRDWLTDPYRDVHR